MKQDEILLTSITTLISIFLTKDWLLRKTKTLKLSYQLFLAKNTRPHKVTETKKIFIDDRLYALTYSILKDTSKSIALFKIKENGFSSILDSEGFEAPNFKIIPTSSLIYDFLIYYTHAGSGSYLDYLVLKTHKEELSHPAIFLTINNHQRGVFKGRISVEKNKFIIHGADLSTSYMFSDEVFVEDKLFTANLKRDLANYDHLRFEHDKVSDVLSAYFNNEVLVFKKIDLFFESNFITLTKGARIFLDCNLKEAAMLRFFHSEEEYKIENVSGFDLICFNSLGRTNFSVNVGYGDTYVINFLIAD